MAKSIREIRSKLTAMAADDSSRGDFQKALRRYQRLSGLEPDNPAHLVKLGELYEKLGRRDEAIDAWSRAADRFAADAFDLKAVALYKRALALGPSRAEASTALADTLCRLDRPAEAIAVLKEARGALEDQGRIREALDVRLQLTRLEPFDTVARAELARDLDEAGLSHEAISECAAVIVELARAGAPERIPPVFESLWDLRPAGVAPQALKGLVDRCDMDSVRSQIAETLGKDPVDEGVDQELERLLVESTWRDAVGQVLQEVRRIHEQRSSGRP